MNMFTAPQPDYPIDALPRELRLPTHEIQRNTQVPPALAAMAVLGATSLACQGLIDVKLPTGKVCAVQLNLLGIAISGERKTTIDGYAYSPFYSADLEAAARHTSDIAEHDIALESWKLQGQLLRKPSRDLCNKVAPEDMAALLEAHARQKPQMPRLHRFIRQDITGRALIDALEGTGQSIGLITDEGDVLFRSTAMQGLGNLNRAWDSPPLLALDRADQEHVFVSHPRLTVSILTQPAVIRQYLSKHGDEARGSGHLARYLVAWPTSTQGYRAMQAAELVWDHLPNLHARFTELIQEYVAMRASGHIERQVLEFSDDAKERWFQLANKTEWMLRPGDYFHDLNDFASKAMEMVARVAALFHHVNRDEGKISLDTLERAIAIVGWHLDEAKRLFSADFIQPQHHIDAQAICRYLRERVWRGNSNTWWIARTHLLRNGPVRSRSRLNAALDVLLSAGAIWFTEDARTKKKFVNLYNAYFSAL